MKPITFIFFLFHKSFPFPKHLMLCSLVPSLRFPLQRAIKLHELFNHCQAAEVIACGGAAKKGVNHTDVERVH